MLGELAIMFMLQRQMAGRVVIQVASNSLKPLGQYSKPYNYYLPLLPNTQAYPL